MALWRHVILVMAINLAFGITNVLFKLVLNQGMNRLIIVAYRQLASVVILTPIACLRERKGGEAKLTAWILGCLFFNALIGITLAQYLFLFGLEYTSSSFSTAFVNLAPVFTFLLALLFRQERVNLRSIGGKAKILGTLVCFGGVLLLISYQGVPVNKITHEYIPKASNPNMKVSGKTSTGRWIVGSIFLTGSSVTWSSWFLVQARIGKMFPRKYCSTAILSFFSAVQSTILCFAIKRDPTIWVLRGKLSIFTLLFSGMVGSGLGYVGMSWCVEKRGAVFTAAFSPFTQVFVIIIDLALVHEQIYLGSILGSIVVFVGLYILLWGQIKDCKEAESDVLKPSDAVRSNGSSCPTSLVLPVR